MAELVLDCPHCAERGGFVFGGEYEQVDKAANWSWLIWNTLFVCRSCRRGVVVLLKRVKGEHTPAACEGDPRNEGFKLLEVHPKPQPVAVPEHLPERIARDYKEAADSLRRRSFTLAGMGFRKVLLRATTALAAGTEITCTKREDLKSRIDELAGKKLITPAMGEWAHLIRLNGNEANHEEDVVFEQSARWPPAAATSSDPSYSPRGRESRRAPEPTPTTSTCSGASPSGTTGCGVTTCTRRSAG